jgi:hypothetical protein
MNKFNIGDMVIPTKKAIKKSHLIDGVAKIVNIDEYSTNEAKYEITYYSNSNDAMYYANDEDLELIEQDTKEETTEDKTIKIDIPPQKLLVKSEVSGLDYEKEYYKSMTKHSELLDTIELQEEIIFNMVLINQKKYD